MSVVTTTFSRARRRRPIRRPGPALTAALCAALVLPTGASALTVDTVRLPGEHVSGDWYPRDLAVGPDGTVRALLERWGPEAAQREVVVGANRLVGDPLQLLAPLASQGPLTSAALSTTGAVVAYRSNRRPHPKLRATIWEGGKQVGLARTISDQSHSFRGGWAYASVNGAASISFGQHLGGGLWEERVAIRPAGGPRFLPSVVASPTDQPIRTRKSRGESSTTIWGPGGDGVMLWPSDGEGSILRRIQRDGALGPAVRLPVSLDSTGYGYAAVAIGPDGEIVCVEQTFATEGDWVPIGDDDEGPEHQRLNIRARVVSIPADSNTPGAPVVLRELSGWDDEITDYAVGADVGADGHVIVAVAGGPNRIEIFEGGLDPASLQPVASFPNRDWAHYADVEVVHTADGGAAVFWSGDTRVSLRGPGGPWSQPQDVLPRGKTGYSVLESPRPLPDGGVAAIVRRNSDDEELGDGQFVIRIHR